MAVACTSEGYLDQRIVANLFSFATLSFPKLENYVSLKGVWEVLSRYRFFCQHSHRSDATMMMPGTSRKHPLEAIVLLADCCEGDKHCGGASGRGGDWGIWRCRTPSRSGRGAKRLAEMEGAELSNSCLVPFWVPWRLAQLLVRPFSTHSVVRAGHKLRSCSCYILPEQTWGGPLQGTRVSEKILTAAQACSSFSRSIVQTCTVSVCNLTFSKEWPDFPFWHFSIKNLPAWLYLVWVGVAARWATTWLYSGAALSDWGSVERSAVKLVIEKQVSMTLAPEVC